MPRGLGWESGSNAHGAPQTRARVDHRDGCHERQDEYREHWYQCGADGRRGESDDRRDRQPNDDEESDSMSGVGFRPQGTALERDSNRGCDASQHQRGNGIGQSARREDYRHRHKCHHRDAQEASSRRTTQDVTE